MELQQRINNAIENSTLASNTPAHANTQVIRTTDSNQTSTLSNLNKDKLSRIIKDVVKKHMREPEPYRERRGYYD